MAGCSPKSPIPGEAGRSGPELMLESPFLTYRLGARGSLNLKLVGEEARIVSGKLDGVEAASLKSPFQKSLDFVPRREGMHAVGPFEMEVNGRKLRSNALEIQVLPPWNKGYGQEFRLNRRALELGETAELAMEEMAPSYRESKLFGVQLEPKWAVATLAGTVTETLPQGGKENFHVMVAYRIRPTAAGVFRLGREDFRALPANVALPELRIEVRGRRE